MSIENPERLFNDDEMERFGLDPRSEADRREWLETTPESVSPDSPDYSQDSFEFGGLPRQQISDKEATE